jgi:tetratricopeptide (TPR) repeat protein
MSERITKRRLKQDKFIDTVNDVLSFASEHLMIVVLGIAGFVALVTLAVRIGGTAVGGQRTRGVDLEAEKALAGARTSFLTGRAEIGRDALEAVRSLHSGSRAAREATYLLGNTLFELGDYARAREVFEQFLKKPAYGDLLQDGARLGIAACKEESGDLPGAAADYRLLWENGASPGLRIDAAFGAARCTKAQGLPAEAKGFLEKIVDTYGGSPEAERARYALLEMGGA